MQLSPSLRWFQHLRLLAFGAQAAVLIFSVAVLKLTLPWQWISLTLLAIPLSNLFVKALSRKISDEKKIIGGLMALDTMILTAVLCFAGGATNPFTIFYLLQVVLAALLLNAAWTWGIAFLSSAGFALLFVFPRYIPEWEHHGAHDGLSLHLVGMLIAYIAAAALSSYFLSKIAKELRLKERMLERLENSNRNQQKLAALTTITANAAHELSTPLGTIALVSHELESNLKEKGLDPESLEDFKLLKSQVMRCKSVLQELSEKTGDMIGECPQSFSLHDLLKDAMQPLSSHVPINLECDTREVIYNAPRKALTVAVRSLVKNAIEVSREGGAIDVKAKLQNGKAKVSISDQGPGMTREVKERIGEPLFSTKPNGQGMGLGVYLSKLTVEQLGGSLSHETESIGTTAVLTFPENCTLLKAGNA